MINKIALKVVRNLIDNSIIAADDQELYLYGFFVLFSQILYLILTIIIGVSLGIVLESILFYFFFQFIRRYAGGIHASSELKCGIATTSSIFLCLLCIKLCEANHVQMPILILTILAAVSILILCPLDTPEKPLTEVERKHFRKISLIVLAMITIVIAVSMGFKKQCITLSACFSIILEGILLVAGKIKRVYYSINEK